MQENTFSYRAAALMGNHYYVYSLPFERGKRFFVAQGYESAFSHKGDYAIDFKMRQGTKVLAARGGVVVFARDSFTTGGVSKKYVGKGNGITIQHADSTFAHYWHLRHKGAVVALGDTVQEGQHIGWSGSTGFSAFPHLHFEVTRDRRISSQDFPVLFYTGRGARFLQPLRWYKSI